MDDMRKQFVHDPVLRLDACCFRGYTRPFPSHFHTYYVIGYVQAGCRTLFCRDGARTLCAGQLLVLNPGDVHGCTPGDERDLTYRALHIPRETMASLYQAVTGSRTVPALAPAVVQDRELNRSFCHLHTALTEGVEPAVRREALLQFMAALFDRCTRSVPSVSYRPEVQTACRYMERCYDRHLSLEDLCRCVGLSKSALLRCFAATGSTPYGYLESVRVGQAQALLEQGVPPAEAALRTGFSDQSHLSRYFSRYMGMAPGAYRMMYLKNQAEKDL